MRKLIGLLLLGIFVLAGCTHNKGAMQLEDMSFGKDVEGVFDHQYRVSHLSGLSPFIYYNKAYGSGKLRAPSTMIGQAKGKSYLLYQTCDIEPENGNDLQKTADEAVHTISKELLTLMGAANRQASLLVKKSSLTKRIGELQKKQGQEATLVELEKSADKLGKELADSQKKFKDGYAKLLKYAKSGYFLINWKAETKGSGSASGLLSAAGSKNKEGFLIMAGVRQSTLYVDPEDVTKFMGHDDGWVPTYKLEARSSAFVAQESVVSVFGVKLTYEQVKALLAKPEQIQLAMLVSHMQSLSTFGFTGKVTITKKDLAFNDKLDGEAEGDNQWHAVQVVLTQKEDLAELAGCKK